ncbi:RHS repeat domain-containing protein [Providencia stuartii]|uniref:RHS repeat domain-containing protein n=2 Tax=Providencia TaxID=586 RepID=UPI000B163222|nr:MULTISPECIES: RHS repeat-associated core domain-containing protein [Providencia]SUC41235.1 Cell wall-associated polypeptide CWBP200 [Providencia stuartii]
MEDHYRGWVEYLYDSEQRLKKVSSGENMDAMLFYDRADNLLERPQSEIEAQTPSMPALSPQGDRLLQFQGWQYRHDAYGNVISRGHPNQAKQTYQYDGDNRLVIAQTSDMKAQYHYDALGRRIHKVVESRAYGTLKRHETHFVWQGLRLLQEQDINTGKCQTYCYEEHGSYTPLAVIVKQPSGYHYYWHHCDINSAPLDVTNEQGNTVWSGKYERFGFVRSSPLSFYSDPEREMESFEQNLRYAGQYFDNETGLHFNTFRFYDPQIGRFIMPDPIGLLGGMNLYRYAPNPLSHTDPLGLINPNDLWYTQNSISDIFAQGPWKGKTVEEAIIETRKLGKLPDGLQISYEKIIMPNGQEVYATLNNRTTYVAQQAGLKNVDAIDKKGKGLNTYNKLTDGGSRLPSPNHPEVKLKKC